METSVFSSNMVWTLVLGIPGIIVATTIHEFVRAALSTAFGDNYPKSQGRLTLNPFKHFEPIGFLMMFYTGGFGWGKPVETSALYYKNRKRDTLLVAILPSVVNFLLGIAFLFISQVFGGSGLLQMLFYYTAYYNIALALYQFLPVAPMDCVKVLSVVLPANQYFKYMQNEKLIQMLFLFLLFFGLITGFMNVIIYGIISIFSGAFGMFGTSVVFGAI